MRKNQLPFKEPPALKSLFLFLFFLFRLSVSAQDVQPVSGVVTDEKGESVAGATVTIRGTQRSTMTGADGRFSIDKTTNDTHILVSFMGYKTQEVALEGKNELKIILAEDTKVLDEVVVIGYGVMRKKDLTGSIICPTAKHGKCSGQRRGSSTPGE